MYRIRDLLTRSGHRIAELDVGTSSSDMVHDDMYSTCVSRPIG